ncbi:MAG: GUN4 domain-containing protein [Aphanothece sp. CMT-3BRIN-NPC111]|jgi:hypothetical protein|nr:GUN4 domain-containing protein [Aphanothece sp. CMT-3BRIN-NPC111]
MVLISTAVLASATLLESTKAIANPEIEPSISLNPSPSADLKSSIGIDYSQLQRLLAAGNWQAADLETRTIIEKLVYPGGDLYQSARFDLLPCEDINTIDRLWLQASGGRFGLSVQQHLWETLRAKNGSDTKTAVDIFGQQVGWRRIKPLTEEERQLKWFASEWLLDNELNFSLKAPVGHLPWSGISSNIILSLLEQSGPGCGSCTIDAIYLQEERYYNYLPALFSKVKSCLCSNAIRTDPKSKF